MLLCGTYIARQLVHVPEELSSRVGAGCDSDDLLWGDEAVRQLEGGSRVHQAEPDVPHGHRVLHRPVIQRHETYRK